MNHQPKSYRMIPLKICQCFSFHVLSSIVMIRKILKGPDHVNDELAEALALPFGEVLEDVTVLLVQQLEAHSQVVVLQNRLVVIHQRQLRVCGHKVNTG